MVAYANSAGASVSEHPRKTMNTNFDHRDTPLPTSYFEKKYNLSRVTIWRYRRAGLPAVGVGSKIWIKESDFLTFIQARNGQTISAASQKTQEAK